MDEHGLPIVGAGVDYTKVPALEHKNTLTFLNNFIVHTTQFLNKFSNVCEERLSELSIRIQRLDISLNILEAKLSSIPGLEEVQASTQYEPPTIVASAGASTATGSGSAPAAQPAASGPPPPSAPTATEAGNEPVPPPQPVAEASKGRKAKDDPRFQKYFKMKRLGVNPLQIAMLMKQDGLNPNVLDDEDAELPEDDNVAGSSANRDDDDSSDEDSSDKSSSDQDSDDSDESD